MIHAYTKQTSEVNKITTTMITHRFYLLEISKTAFRIVCNSVFNQKISQNYYYLLRMNHLRFSLFHSFNYRWPSVKLSIISCFFLTYKTSTLKISKSLFNFFSLIELHQMIFQTFYLFLDKNIIYSPLHLRLFSHKGNHYLLNINVY